MRGIDLLLQAARDMDSAPAPTKKPANTANTMDNIVTANIPPNCSNGSKAPSTPKLVLPPPQEMNLPFPVLPQTPSTDSNPSMAPSLGQLPQIGPEMAQKLSESIGARNDSKLPLVTGKDDPHPGIIEVQPFSAQRSLLQQLSKFPSTTNTTNTANTPKKRPSPTPPKKPPTPPRNQSVSSVPGTTEVNKQFGGFVNL